MYSLLRLRRQWRDGGEGQQRARTELTVDDAGKKVEREKPR